MKIPRTTSISLIGEDADPTAEDSAPYANQGTRNDTTTISNNANFFILSFLYNFSYGLMESV